MGKILFVSLESLRSINQGFCRAFSTFHMGVPLPLAFLYRLYIYSQADVKILPVSIMRIADGERCKVICCDVTNSLSNTA